jgi:hypothetical protein
LGKLPPFLAVSSLITVRVAFSIVDDHLSSLCPGFP